jgi:hypothetical protein
MAFLRPHIWVDVPLTRTERKRVLNVGENKHTVMIWDRKYQDIDTGKFDTNKMQTINSYTLADIFCNSHISNWPCERESAHVPVNEDIIINKKLKSYDDIRIKTLPITHETIVIDRMHERAIKTARQREKRKIRKEALEIQRMARIQEANDYLNALEQKRKDEADYQVKLKNAERRTQGNNIYAPYAQYAENQIYLGGNEHGKPVTNIRPNNIGRWGK